MRDRHSARAHAHGVGGGVSADLYPLSQYNSWRSKWTSLLKIEAVCALWNNHRAHTAFSFLSLRPFFLFPAGGRRGSLG